MKISTGRFGVPCTCVQKKNSPARLGKVTYFNPANPSSSSVSVSVTICHPRQTKYENYECIIFHKVFFAINSPSHQYFVESAAKAGAPGVQHQLISQGDRRSTYNKHIKLRIHTSYIDLSLQKFGPIMILLRASTRENREALLTRSFFQKKLKIVWPL